MSEAARARPTPGSEEGTYAGWYIGAAVIVAVLAVSFTIWFIYHP